MSGPLQERRKPRAFRKRADQAKSSRLPPLQQGRSVLVALRGPRGSIQHERMRPRTVAPPRLCQANDAGEVECEPAADQPRSEEHTSELQSLMRISSAVSRLK